MRTVVFAALCAFPFAALPVHAQTPPAPADAAKAGAAASRYQSLIGTVESEDASKKSFSVKQDKGESTTVKFDDRTSFLRIPAGETDIKKATKAAAADVGVGDRILARVFVDDPTKPAVTFVITKQADLAQRQQKTLEEWQTQSVAGLVTAFDKAAKTATIKVQAGNAPAKDVAVDLSGRVNYEHYSPETGQYQPGDGSDIAVGDRLRVIGSKNADVTSVKADAVQSGAFRNVSAQIRTVDAAGMQISGIDPGTKKPITVVVKPFTAVKRLDDQTALILARRLNPTFQAAGGRGGRGGMGPGGAGAPGGAPAGGPPNAGGGTAGGLQAGAAPAGGPAGSMAGRGAGRGGFGGGGRGMDPAHMIDQQPTIQLADLKPGEALIINGVSSGDPSKITAITVLAGVEQILRASPASGADPLGGNWNFGGGGGGGDQ